MAEINLTSGRDDAYRAAVVEQHCVAYCRSCRAKRQNVACRHEYHRMIAEVYVADRGAGHQRRRPDAFVRAVSGKNSQSGASGEESRHCSEPVGLVHWREHSREGLVEFHTERAACEPPPCLFAHVDMLVGIAVACKKNRAREVVGLEVIFEMIAEFHYGSVGFVGGRYRIAAHGDIDFRAPDVVRGEVVGQHSEEGIGHKGARIHSVVWGEA